jgi:hypothetical protein
MRTLVELFRERSSFVRVQIIQTVSIILMNINNQRSLCECDAAGAAGTTLAARSQTRRRLLHERGALHMAS